MRLQVAVPCVALLVVAAAAFAAEPTAVTTLDAERFAGTWYELARFPSFFEKGCVNVTSSYTRRDDGGFTVTNRCHKDGKDSSVEGKAWAPDSGAPGKLKLQIVWPFRSDYWVFETAPDYSWALTGTPDRSKAWILSKKKALDPETYERLVKKLADMGFDTGKLERVLQK